MNRRIFSALLVALLAAVPAGAGIFCSEPAVAIPDDDALGISDSLSVAHPETIGDLDVLLEIPHTFVGDLTVTLKHEESGQEVILVDRPGVPDISQFGCPGHDLILRLDDEATATAEDDCTTVDDDPAYLPGTYRPGDPPGSLLAAFDNLKLAATWTLTVADLAADDAGSLQRWCLIAPTPVVSIGGELQVNTYTTSSQLRPAVAASESGEFVVVWRSNGSAGSDSDSYSVQGQRFDAAGAPAGGEFQVNSYTTSYQVSPAVAVDVDGDFVVVWFSDGSTGTDSDSSSIQGRRYASGGAALGGEFQVNTYTTDRQFGPAVAVDADGDFVVVWQSYGSAGTDSQAGSIQGQRYAADGSPLGGEFQVNSYTLSGQRYPAVAGAPNGDFVVVWESDGSAGTDSESGSIQGQRYAADGLPLGGEFQVNAYTPYYQRGPAVAVDADGGFVVVWTSAGSAGTDPNVSIQGQRFNSAGGKIGDEFQVNTYTTAAQVEPAVALEPGGDFVVVWYSYGSTGSDSFASSIQGRRYAADASPLAGEFQVNTYSYFRQFLPVVAVTTGGDFMVVWESDDSGGTDTFPWSVQSQRYGDPCVGGECVFADGFESGDVSAWSSSGP